MYFKIGGLSLTVIIKNDILNNEKGVNNMTDTLRKDIKTRLDNGEYHCEKEYTLSIISGKYKLVILWHLGHEGIHRFSELQKLFPTISHKVLTNQLKELIEDGIVHREVYPVVPPRVEYSMTEAGMTIIPLIDMMYEWGKKRLDELKPERVNPQHDCCNRK